MLHTRVNFINIIIITDLLFIDRNASAMSTILFVCDTSIRCCPRAGDDRRARAPPPPPSPARSVKALARSSSFTGRTAARPGTGYTVFGPARVQLTLYRGTVLEHDTVVLARSVRQSFRVKRRRARTMASVVHLRPVKSLSS